MKKELWRLRCFGYRLNGVRHYSIPCSSHVELLSHITAQEAASPTRFPATSLLLSSVAVSRLVGSIGRLPALRSPNFEITGHVPLFPIGLRSICSFSQDDLPIIRDPDIQRVCDDFMATSWSNLPDDIITNAKKALSKNSKDAAGRETLANVFRAAEAVEEFGGILVTLRNEIDDFIGMSGKKIGPLPYEHAYALDEVYKRYEEYLEAFGSNEEYLRKKVETELGTKIIHLKMRCSFLDSQ